ncbi:uncharacterized protein LOC131251171 [Magnolia sinica]|uniref:uncharacterized protein LOC131251171 n=1 Tax=Magnolia sinica TaxID=86752 RepID=UPI00265A4E59|nr:uncharacterized protein LOC131251171 [Magnolia sinica]XP_058107706.1 uncharacterized protein LOC131251171 [Magnolia sinica]XP_058107707.1 uncharacterized protein LOC131251171 [Magnolia sinica]XP_058107708.1 uncharacterized protein LOC131251171 [Magnolia sinica]XP_058107709.1 uncharacterized protein LOC131251171 [Magnolia sinica]
MEASPDPSTSSRREGLFDGESIDMTENTDTENIRLPLYNSNDGQKCGLCGRHLRQRSPWSSYRIVRSGDMPIAGVLSCSHVFHAECLEETTPKTQIHDPPCPTCLKIAGRAEASSSISEPLKEALKSADMDQGINIASDGMGNSSDRPSDHMESGLRRNRSLLMPRRGGTGSSLIKNHFKKHLSFKGKAGKELFGAKASRRTGSSSSDPHANQNPVGCPRTGRPSKK